MRILHHLRRRAVPALILALMAAGFGTAGSPAVQAEEVNQASRINEAGEAGTERERRTATPRRPAGSALDRRVALLAAELNLSQVQQIQVNAVLQRQREAVSQVWNDEALAPAIRISRTQAVSERTEDAIRSLLTDEQKKKYFKPRPAGVAPGGTPADLATWMDRVNRR